MCGLGVLLYEILTGRPPFQGDPIQALRDAFLHRDPLRPRSRARSGSIEIETVCREAMAREPARRSASAGGRQPPLSRARAGHGATERSRRRVGPLRARNPAPAASLLTGSLVAGRDDRLRSDDYLATNAYNGTRTGAGALTLSFTGATAPVPEPPTILLLGLGAAALLRRRRRPLRAG